MKYLSLIVGILAVAWETGVGITAAVMLDEGWRWVPILMLCSGVWAVMNAILWVDERQDKTPKLFFPSVIGWAVLKFAVWCLLIAVAYMHDLPADLHVTVKVIVWTEGSLVLLYLLVLFIIGFKHLFDCLSHCVE
jgi:hypothetical protein